MKFIIYIDNYYYIVYYIVWFRFGSISISSICYRPGLVYVRFWFLRFLVDLGSVWCLEHSALIFVCFPALEKANIYCFPQEIYCFPYEVSWITAFKERRTLNPENPNFLKLLIYIIYFEETYFFFFFLLKYVFFN